jgi:acyl CoA:acetate/3-ketoacid CoA transferase alpha subunit
VGLIHVHRADRHGNAQIEGISGFAFEMARASKRLILSAEEIVPTDEIRKYPILPGGRRRPRAVRPISWRDGLRLWA